MIQLLLTTWRGKHDALLWECSSHTGAQQWSNPDSLPRANALAFLWQRINQWRFEGPSLYCIVLDGCVLRVYSKAEEDWGLDESVVVRDLTKHEVHEQIQIYMHMLESKDE